MLRALAIALVLLSHGGVVFSSWLGRGFPHVLSVAGTFGIELFFVLSGFLVGRILERTLAAPARPGPGTLARFLARRWWRTLPLYLAAVLALARLQPPAPGHVLRDIFRYATFTQNLLPPQLDDFFPVSWTLAVEEWFYLGFALLLWGARRMLGGCAAIVAVLALFLAGPPVARALLFIDPSQYRIVPYWLDGIGWGVLAALVSTWRPVLFARGVALAPLGLALTAFFWADETWRFTPYEPHRVFGFGVIAAALALFLPAACAWRPARTATVRGAVRWLSMRSYGIYITHVTILQEVGRHLAAWGPGACMAASAVLVAVVPELTWRCIEAPALRLRPAERPPTPPAAAR